MEENNNEIKEELNEEKKLDDNNNFNENNELEQNVIKDESELENNNVDNPLNDSVSMESGIKNSEDKRLKKKSKKKIIIFIIIIVLIALGAMSYNCYNKYYVKKEKTTKKETKKETKKDTEKETKKEESKEVKTETLDINSSLVQNLFAPFSYEDTSRCYMSTDELNNNNKVKLRIAYDNLDKTSIESTLCSEFVTSGGSSYCGSKMSTEMERAGSEEKFKEAEKQNYTDSVKATKMENKLH